ncbi:MAG: hypothetical protein NT001_07290 [Candidatus Woesearchaeota archaeon]|nr:hypothetical protein [Candidatus Woesearchaeota archaeon]
MQKEQLQKLGLLESESKVYLALLNLGSTSAGKIAKETELNRVSVYKALENLSKKGLVSHAIKANIKYFEAVNPAALGDLIEEKKKQLDEIKKQVPLLEDIYKGTKKKIESNIYEGAKGAKALWENWLKEMRKGDEWLILGAPKHAEIFGGYFEEFNKRRARKGIYMRLIYNQDATSLIKIREKQPLTKVALMSKEYVTPASIEIINDHIAIVVYEPEIIIFTINSKEVAHSFKQYFELLWKIAKK